MLDNLLHRVCDNGENKNVEALLELGADPFSEDVQGMAAVTKAVLSNIEPRTQIKFFQELLHRQGKKRLYKIVSFIKL